eukprot:5893360-Karenia_brevis.AAC.1
MIGLHGIKDSRGEVHTAPSTCANLLAAFWLPTFSARSIDVGLAKSVLADVVPHVQWDWSLMR